MKIFIKSFNRPYALDRCICSIKENVTNYSDIIILDDGTEKKYLKILLEKHRDLKVLFSPTADYKYAYIINNLDKWFYQREAIYDPANFWTESIAAYADEYFLLLEDDFWVKDKIDLAIFEKHLQTNHVIFTKLMQVDNESFSPAQEIDVKVFIENNPTLCYYLPKISNLDEVWKIFLVAGAIYRKDYYIHNFTGVRFFSDETYLLQKAIQYVKDLSERAVRIKFTRTETDAIKQGWSSTAIGRADEIANGFNAYQCNGALNEAWANGWLNPLEGLPGDFPEAYILTMFHKMALDHSQIEAWRYWRNKWVNAYKEIGLDILK